MTQLKKKKIKKLKKLKKHLTNEEFFLQNPKKNENGNTCVLCHNFRTN
jgi:nitrate/TMAO reductase-like tetraheme cytochrome c subunit